MDERKNKVFITNKGGHDYSNAARYGELIYVTEGTVGRFATSNIYRAFIEAMRDSTKDDYMLVTSMNTLNAIGAAVFARKHGVLNLLLFKDGEYIARKIDIDSLLTFEAEGP